MPNKWTFTIKPIKKLLEQEMNDGLWLDSFAGLNSPAHIRNDINPNSNAEFHLDSIDFLKKQNDCSVDGVLYDPPYSHFQSFNTYRNKEQPNRIRASIEKDEIARITKKNGKAISFGWSSNGIGKKRGFELGRILLVCHGGHHNDTIVTIEHKLV